MFFKDHYGAICFESNDGSTHPVRRFLDGKFIPFAHRGPSKFVLYGAPLSYLKNECTPVDLTSYEVMMLAPFAQSHPALIFVRMYMAARYEL